jgi:hypothetical protein
MRVLVQNGTNGTPVEKSQIITTRQRGACINDG